MSRLLPIIMQRFLVLGLPLVLTTAAAVLLLPISAHANGRVAQFVWQEAGPYEIALGMIPDPPVVGSLHLTVSVLEASSRAPVLDARIAVTGRGPEADGTTTEIGPISALNNPVSPAFYDTNTEVGRAGIWTITVAVSSDRGDASADFLIEVKSPNPIFRVLTWATVLVFLALIGIGIYPLLLDRLRRAQT